MGFFRLNILIYLLSIVFIHLCCYSPIVYVMGQLELCQANCESSDRLTGPTRMTDTRPHPWKVWYGYEHGVWGLSIYIHMGMGHVIWARVHTHSYFNIHLYHTIPYPYYIQVAPFPSSTSGFCQLGCQIFYVNVPKNTTCKRLCGYFYRYYVWCMVPDINMLHSC
ncbi:hypothetical protein EON63_05105 [archaeon]|nr:MAG: hypothetical protein EON63_05105 [archaeon]